MIAKELVILTSTWISVVKHFWTWGWDLNKGKGKKKTFSLIETSSIFIPSGLISKMSQKQ